MRTFDSQAKNYHAGFDDPIKRLFGRDARAFLAPKINRLLRVADRTFGHSPATRLSFLDFGCGSADFLVALAEQEVPWNLEGCDVSEGMLSEARRRHKVWMDRLSLWNPDSAPFKPRAYDIVTAICVFHHIPQSEWNRVAGTIFQGLRPGGIFVLVEHNPLNPVTNWMVKRTELDKSAVLVSAKKLQQILRAAGFKIIDVEFFLFFPPRIRWLLAAEPLLQWLPLGGQYLVAAQKCP
jgi:SAM-dependent methyltransferase